jgi:hypothetical protein
MSNTRTCLVASLVAGLLVGTVGADDRFVQRRGQDDGNDCLSSATPCRTISYAIAQAGQGDTIKVASGRYRDFIRFTGAASMTLSGGWTSDFTSRNPRTDPTAVRPVRRPKGQVALAVRTLSADTHERIDLTVDGFVFEHCGSGAVVVSAYAGDSVTAAFVGTTFTRSRGPSAVSGGVVDVEAYGSLLNLSLTDSRVVRNRANPKIRRTAGLNLRAGAGTTNVTMTNCLLANDTAPSPGEGGAMNVILNGETSLTIDLTNTTISANSAGRGGGIYVENQYASNTAVLNLKNVILWGNSAGEGGDLLTEATPGNTVISAEHSDLGDVVLGAGGTFNDLGGNLNVAPGFGTDFHLAPGSPMVDAGTNAGAPATDIDGDARPLDGDGDTVATTDIGADERVP